MILDPLLDTAPCGFVRLANDGTMVAVNLTLAETLGYARVDLQGWHIQKILPPGGRVFYNTHVFPLLKMHGRADEIYIPLRSRDGKDIPMLLNAKRRSVTEGEVNDCVFVRMLQRHMYEDELLQARRLAEQASATKGRFLSMVSHDLRTPLTAIAGYAELLEQEVMSELQAESARNIRSAANEVARLIADVLAFAQLDSGKVPVRPMQVVLSDAVRRAEVLIRPKMSEAGISFQTDSCMTVAMADPDRLQQVLLNLLSNAVKFTPSGGEVRVGCEERDGQVRLTVADTGIGIPEDQLETIFEPFVQLETGVQPGQQGVGLGLAISRELARAMGGELTARRGAEQGAVFTVELPVWVPADEAGRSSAVVD